MGWCGVGEKRRLANIESNKAVAFPLVKVLEPNGIFFFFDLQVDLSEKHARIFGLKSHQLFYCTSRVGSSRRVLAGCELKI